MPISAKPMGLLSWTVGGTDTIREIRGIGYGNGKFVVTASFGKIAYSNDCQNWSMVSNSQFTSNSAITDVAYGNDVFAAVGSEGQIAYSSDCVLWNRVSDGAFTDPANII